MLSEPVNCEKVINLTVHCTLYTVQCTLCTVHCAVHSVHCVA